MRKLAMIRKDDEDGCPFGLGIPHACQTVGELVDRMAPLDSLGDESSEDEKELEVEAENLIEQATAFYDREVSRYEE